MGIIALCLLLGRRGRRLAAGLHAVLYVVVAAPLINAVGHWRSQQDYDSTARNSRVLAWFTGGESLHNNHHAQPRAARSSVRSGEFDPSWPVIRGLAALRLIVIAGTAVRLARAPSLTLSAGRGTEPNGQ